MPTEAAEKKIESLSNKYNTLSNRSSAASTGESGIAAMTKTSSDIVTAAKNDVNSKKSVQSRASSANKTAKNTLKSATKKQTSKANSAKKAVSKSKLSSSKKKSITKSIKAGKKVSTKGLKGNVKKQITAYNDAVKSKSTAKKKVSSTSSSLATANSNLKDAQTYLDTVQGNVKGVQGESISGSYANQPAYVYQNSLLQQQVDNKKDQYNKRQTAVKESSKNLATMQKKTASAQSAKNTADKNVKNKGANILKSKSNKKKLSASQEKAIKNGQTVSLKGIKDKTLLKQLKSYNELVKKAKTASSNLAKAKQNETDATNALATATQNANDAAADWAAEQTNAAVQSQANIKAYYDAKQNYESIQGNNASSAAKLKQAKGEDLTTEDYQSQIDSNEKQAKIYEEEAIKMQENLDKQVASGAIKEGSQEWMQMKGEIDACKGSADDLRSTNEDLKNSMRDDIYYRGFERAIKAAQNLQNALTAISSLIDEDAMFDDDGNLTDYGTAAIATNIANVRSEKDELADLMAERAKMFEHRDEYSDTEWTDAVQKSDQDIADAVKNIKSAEDSVTTILKNNAKQKLDSINKTIDAYKEAIQNQKSYYEYDKQLKSSNKEIQILKSQINALNGVKFAAPFYLIAGIS